LHEASKVINFTSPALPYIGTDHLISVGCPSRISGRESAVDPLKMEDILVSICTITYNQENYIAQTIEGVLSQKTNFKYVLVIGEDCSSDKTREICISYKTKYPDKINLILNNKNLGGQNNIFNVLNNCRGKYIAICEGDDYWIDPYKLQKQVDFLENNEDYGLVWTDVDFYYQSTKSYMKGIFRNKILPVYNSFDDILINRPYIAPCTWLFRREYLQNKRVDYCDISFPMVLDISANSKIKYLDEVTTVYRHLKVSASHYPSSANRYKRIKEIYRIQKDYLKKYNLSLKMEEAIDLKYYESVYPYVVIFDDNKVIEKGRKILKNIQSKSMKIRFSLFLSNFSLGIFALKFIYLLKDKYSKYQ
jgi:glycosyltransferase involved in cell wall biosynthesis